MKIIERSTERIKLAWNDDDAELGHTKASTVEVTARGLIVNPSKGKSQLYIAPSVLHIKTGVRNRALTAHNAFDQNWHVRVLNFTLLDANGTSVEMPICFSDCSDNQDALALMRDIATIWGFTYFDIDYHDHFFLEASFKHQGKALVADIADTTFVTTALPDVESVNQSAWKVIEQEDGRIVFERPASITARLSIWMMYALYLGLFFVMYLVLRDMYVSTEALIQMILVVAIVGGLMIQVRSRIIGSTRKGRLEIDKRQQQFILGEGDARFELPMGAMRDIRFQINTNGEGGNIDMYALISVSDDEEISLRPVMLMAPLWQKDGSITFSMVRTTLFLVHYLGRYLPDSQ